MLLCLGVRVVDERRCIHEKVVAEMRLCGRAQLEDMTERDWRIFKEDFNIAFKVQLACLFAVVPNVVRGCMEGRGANRIQSKRALRIATKTPAWKALGCFACKSVVFVLETV